MIFFLILKGKLNFFWFYNFLVFFFLRTKDVSTEEWSSIVLISSNVSTRHITPRKIIPNNCFILKFQVRNGNLGLFVFRPFIYFLNLFFINFMFPSLFWILHSSAQTLFLSFPKFFIDVAQLLYHKNFRLRIF